MRLDPVLLEILSHKVVAVADQMSSALQRASRSTYVKEASDYGVALIDRQGQVFGFPSASGVNTIDRLCGTAIRAVSDLVPGDVIATNDPYTSGALSTHLPDVHLLRPYFHKGEIVAYGWCFIHFQDMGGRVPSSITPSNHDIFQEGLIIPPMKLVKKGVLNDDLVNVFKANCRTPDLNMADIKAMLGALHVGNELVAEIIERHGLDTFLDCQSDLLDYSAARARTVLRRIPDGTHAFWDYMDDDLVTRIPTRIRVEMTVADGAVHVDVSGTDPQVAAAYNVPTLGQRHPWLMMRLTAFILTHDKTIPKNAGMYRSISFTNPLGTVMNAEFPDAVGVRSAPARRLNDAMTGAILMAAPELMAGPTCGTSCPLVLAEYGPDGNTRIVNVLEPLKGGMGAADGIDGVDARDATMANLNNHPIETVEADTGSIIREYDILTDSGGPGRWRGGTGQVLTVEILRDGGIIMARGMDRMRFPAFGVQGGKPGAPFRAVLNRGRADERALPKIDQLHVNAGDTVTILNPGASGYGDPYLREAEKVRIDVEMGFVSRPAAASEYGVVIDDDGAIDTDATTKARASHVRDNYRAEFNFGPEREAWETVFDDKTMLELNRRLYALPKSVRQETRRRIFEKTVPDLPIAGGTPLAEVLADADAAKARLRRAMTEAFGPAALGN